MSRWMRAAGIGLLTIGLAVTAAPAALAHPSREGGTVEPSVAASRPVSVTLITGDRVVLAGGDPSRVSIVPARPGRTFQRFIVDDRLHVIPSDLRKQYAEGTVDRRLFDVTGLIEVGYDDANTDAIPLIVRQGKGGGAAAGEAMTAAGADAGRRLRSVAGGAFTVEKAEAAAFFEALPLTDAGFGEGIDRIWLDGRSRISLDQSVPQIGAPDAWDAGLTGEGVTVAVLDSGVDSGHPDLDGKVSQREDFTGEGPADGLGHGTHVASTIVGSGAASEGRYQGVAPGAALLDGKVCTSDRWCDESDIIAAMEWAADGHDADVVNLSLGGYDTPETDPLELAVDDLTASTGALFVVAAGNEGPWPQTVGTPASADAALAVGAVDKSDAIADFSSRGPRVGDAAIKPDLTAPGVGIVAARAAGTTMGTPVDDSYVAADGTSMATPHVAGAAALLTQQHPAWGPERLKAALIASAEPNPELGAFEQGTGRVDVGRAIGQDIIPEPAGISFGRASWPHGDDEPVTKTLTYRNLGDADVTLDLAAIFTGPGGSDAPDGALTLDKDSVTVPAGGTASVQLTSDTDHDGPDGAYSGRVTATAGDARVVTAVAVDKEIESYDLMLRGIGRDGRHGVMSAMVLGLESDFAAFPFGDRDEVTVRVPKGRYAIDAMISAPSFKSTTVMVQPVVRVTGDMTWTADARRAKPVSMKVQSRKARPALVDIGFEIASDESALATWHWFDDAKGLYAGHVGPKVSGGRFAMTATFGMDWAVPKGNGRFVNSPVIYKIVDSRAGRFWNGYKKSVRDRDLATLETRFSAQVPKRRAHALFFGLAPGAFAASSAAFVYDLPAKTTVRLSPGAIRWSQDLNEFVVDEEGWADYVISLMQWRPSTFKRGRTYTSRLNAAPFGPGRVFSERFGTFLGVDAPLYSDQGGYLGLSRVDKAFTTLHRGDELLAETDQAGYVVYDGIGPQKATYRITTEATRRSYSRFSTEQRVVWTFDSGVVDEGPLPLWSATLRPKVDARNRSDRARAIIPLRFRAPARARVGKLTTVKVRVSADDGRTWKRAKVEAKGKNAYRVTIPGWAAEDRFVSVEVSAVDRRGNSVKQRTIRAYGLG